MDKCNNRNFFQRQNLSEYATPDIKARRSKESLDDYRSPFIIDRDRILYCDAYRRMQGKTQVAYFANLIDEQITNRMLHVQFVSQIARSIGLILNLNINLIEAAALGHDLGHSPFGHDGEKFLSKECQKYGLPPFHHNIHSYYLVEKFQYHGRGMNLTLQVKDAIVSHNGEKNERYLCPDTEKDLCALDSYINQISTKENYNLRPATLEGCVVRIADTIAYIGTDIEDAIRLNLIDRRDLPPDVISILGNNNSQIVSTLVKDIIDNSLHKPYIMLSEKIAKALFKLKKFNYEKIYKSDFLKKEQTKIEKGFSILFEECMSSLEEKKSKSPIFKDFLDGKNNEYIQNTSDAMKVRDYIAGMTDRYFKKQLENIIIPNI